ncbi:MAG: hypothetical protein JJ863_00870 [Deltaproteobacteria bacterium]|nr:hypothetical protein [Deltaproteobacteria bacterium]
MSAALPAPVERAPGAWIVSPGYDTAFFTASLLVPLTLWLGFSAGVLTGIAVYVLFQLLFNLPHNFQTWTMSVLDEGDRKKHGRRYLLAAVVCLAVLGVPMALSPDGVYPWVRDALIYWGYYHLVRQHYGFLRLYERKMGDVPAKESRFYARYVDAICYLPLLVRFRDPELMTIRVGAVDAWIHHPVLPESAWVPILALWVAFVVAAVAHHLHLWRKGRRGLMPRALLLISVTLAFGLAVLVVQDIIVGIAVVTAYHNLQYLGLTWFHNRNRAAEPAEGDASNSTIGWLRGGKVWLYLLFTMFYGVVIFAPRALIQGQRLAELPLAFVVAMHYYVDSRMWQFPLYPERGRWLRLSRPRA